MWRLKKTAKSGANFGQLRNLFANISGKKQLSSNGKRRCKAAITTAIRLRFDSSEKVGVMTVCYWRHEFIPDDFLHRKYRWKGYTDVDNRKMLPDVDPSAWMPFLLPWHTLSRHGVPRPTAFLMDTTPLDATKKWTCSFFVVVESKPNRSCNSRFSCFSHKIYSSVKHNRLLPTFSGLDDEMAAW